MKKVLVFVAHQDDETIGCGGTLSKFSNLGYDTTVVFVTDGATGIDQTGNFSKNIVNRRSIEAKNACNVLGVNKIKEMKIPCQKVENNQENFHRFIKIIRDTKPDIIITHSPNDKHRDHKAVAKIAIESSWKAQEDIHPELGKKHRISMLWGCEITDLITPDIYVDITGFFNKKIDALKSYNTQEDIIDGYNRFLDGISTVRGFESGVKKAEAFSDLTPFGRLMF